MKRQQVFFGIQGGYDEICKVYQRIFKAPMIYLAVLDPNIGPSVLRAILTMIADKSSEEETWLISTLPLPSLTRKIMASRSTLLSGVDYDNPRTDPSLTRSGTSG